MKKVYNYAQLIYVKGQMKDFDYISYWKYLCLLSHEEVLNRARIDYFRTFEEFFTAVQEGKIWRAEAWHTCILKRPKIRILCGLNCYHITKRNFTEVYVQHLYEDASHESMESLMRNLKADEFAEYLRERNVKLSE